MVSLCKGTHLIECLAGQHYEVELVEDDLGMRKVFGRALDIGRAHIHGNSLDLGRIPAVLAANEQHSVWRLVTASGRPPTASARI
jgi:hypothetical protein